MKDSNVYHSIVWFLHELLLSDLLLYYYYYHEYLVSPYWSAFRYAVHLCQEKNTSHFYDQWLPYSCMFSVLMNLHGHKKKQFMKMSNVYQLSVWHLHELLLCGPFIFLMIWCFKFLRWMHLYSQISNMMLID